MVLRTADVAWVLPRDPGMSGLKKHSEVLAPQVRGGECFMVRERALLGFLLVAAVGLLERAAVEVVEVGDIRGAKERPVAVFLQALHKKVGDPRGGIKVVRTPPLVAGVLAQFQKVLDVEMPVLEVEI